MVVAGRGEDCTACGVGCNGGGSNGLQYVGPGGGDYVQETTFRYVGYGGDFSSARPRRDFTCLISTLCCLLLLPLLLWLMYLLWPYADSCEDGRENWGYLWSPTKQARCCIETRGAYGCKAVMATDIFTPRPGPVDPFNCGNDEAQWQSGWSDEKKSWCCNIHGKGCGGGPALPATSYDCSAGAANWVKGWSTGKKTWCCSQDQKFCDEGLAGPGYGAGAGEGDGILGAPVATPQAGFVPFSQTR